jgi:hypothetical protein
MQAPQAAYAAPPPATDNGNGAMLAAQQAAPVTARRAGGRSPAADLFGAAAQAGGEDDVMTSAPAGLPQVHDAGDQKLTGQRNENSVLFSLSTLTSKPSKDAGPQGHGDASGLIDIRQLSSTMEPKSEANRRRGVDDIMNLAGGGAFSPSLAAPVLSAPAVEDYAAPAPGSDVATPKKSGGKGMLFGLIGAGVLLLGAVAVAFVVIKGKGSGDAATDKPTTSATTIASGASASTAPPTDSLAMNDTATASATATGNAQPPSTGTSTTSAAPTTTKTAPTATTTATTSATTTATATATTTATTTATAQGGSDQPFNMGEAKARLASIAGSVQSCKKGDASGQGRVVVTFAPAGNAQSAVVQGPPFEGTPTGACVASRFRGARVPPFSGSPFSVSKSFIIN